MKNVLLAIASGILGVIGLILFLEFVPYFKGIEIIFVILVIIVAIIVTYFCNKQSDVQLEKEEKIEKQRVQKLEVKYANYVEIVNKDIQNMLSKVENNAIVKDDFGHLYLIKFEEYLNWICKERITGEPDSFIIASCLMYALMHNSMIVTNDIKNYNNEVHTLLTTINCKLAFDVALDVISEPITFNKEKTGEYKIPQKHPKKNILVPVGLIQDVHLYDRILRNIIKDYMANSDACPIMQFSNLLQLIYLNC